MRTLRLSLVGTVILLVLGGRGIVAVAQPGEEALAEAVYSTASESIDSVTSQGTVTYTPDGVRQLRGMEGTEDRVSSDPRGSGTATWVHNEDRYRDLGGPQWGTLRLENEGGAWNGRNLAMELPRETGPASVVFISVWEGEGGYEGLSSLCYTIFPEGPGLGDGVDECITFQGPLPEFPLATATE